MIVHEYEQLTYIDSDMDGIRNPKFSKEYYQELKNLYLKVKNDSFNIEELSTSMKIEISKILYNHTMPYFINSNIQSEILSIKINVIENLDKLEFDKNLIIKPIYISNNIILN